LRSTELSKVVRRAIQGQDVSVAMSDLAFYAPSGNGIAAFVAAPVRSIDGRVLGAVAFQLETASIDALVRDIPAVGATGQVYLVGKDRRLRTNAAQSDQPSALQLRAETEAAARSFGEVSGFVQGPGLFGLQSYAAFGRVELPGLVYGLVVEQTEAELLAPVS